MCGILVLLQAVMAPFMLWRTLCLWCNTPQPLLVVISESMEPAFTKGDILVVTNHDRHFQIGDLPVCWFPGHPFPRVHRIVQVHRSPIRDSAARDILELDLPFELSIMTKGDNNRADDSIQYPKDRPYLHDLDIRGLVKGYIPILGRLVLAVQGVKNTFL